MATLKHTAGRMPPVLWIIAILGLAAIAGGSLFATGIFAGSDSMSTPQIRESAPPAPAAEQVTPFWTGRDFAPITFTAVPNPITTLEEKIGAIYLLAAEGKIDEALGLAPAADREAWRKHLEAMTESVPPSYYNRRGRTAALPPGSSVTITEVYKSSDGTYVFLTSLSEKTGVSVCMTDSRLAPC